MTVYIFRTVNLITALAIVLILLSVNVRATETDENDEYYVSPDLAIAAGIYRLFSLPPYNTDAVKRSEFLEVVKTLEPEVISDTFGYGTLKYYCCIYFTGEGEPPTYEELLKKAKTAREKGEKLTIPGFLYCFVPTDKSLGAPDAHHYGLPLFISSLYLVDKKVKKGMGYTDVEIVGVAAHSPFEFVKIKADGEYFYFSLGHGARELIPAERLEGGKRLEEIEPVERAMEIWGKIEDAAVDLRAYSDTLENGSTPGD